jgi:hypothetical protein
MFTVSRKILIFFYFNIVLNFKQLLFMKNLITLLLSIFLLTFSSCSNDDDSTESIDNSLLFAKWDLVSKKVGNNDVSLTQCEQENLNSSYEFFSNNTSIKKEGYLTSSSACSFDEYSQTYTISNNILTANESENLYEYQEKYYIVSISSNTLVLKGFYFKENYNGSNAEQNLSESEQITYTYNIVN